MYLSLSESYSYSATPDNSHNRQVHRRVWVYAAPPLLQQQWRGLKRLIWRERWGVRNGHPFAEQIGYISDLELSGDQFLQHIQKHWSIENRLHWVRDVRFEEDHARPGGNAPVIWAILNCFVISIVRQLAYRTIPQGVRALTNQLKQVYTIRSSHKLFLHLNETTLQFWLWKGGTVPPQQGFHPCTSS